MFDIDKYLDDMRIKEFKPSDSLIEKTKASCEKHLKPQAEKRYGKNTKFSKAALVAIPAAAMLLIGVFLGAFLFGGDSADPTIAAFYTVDINPSICVNVDENEIVKSVSSQNDDAKELLKTLDCKGKSSTDAIELIIDAAKDAGYLNASNTYVLIGRFGSGNEQALADLQAKLESELDDMIQLLIVSGSLEDKMDADELNVSAGLLKLSRMAEGVEIENDTKVKDVVEEVTSINQDKYTAPHITASSSEKGIALSWKELDFDSMGYTGKVIYKIMSGSSEESLKDMNAVKIGTLSFLSTEEQPTSYYISADSIPGTEKYTYFAVYAVYSEDIYVPGNVVHAVVPTAAPSPSPSPSVTPSPSPTSTPAPTPEPQKQLVDGYISGQYVKLSWQKNERDGFSGYKIVASKTNEHPSYPEDGYIKYITDENTTSKSLYEGYGGLKANTYYYFSITYLYSDGSRIIGNAVKLKVPEKEEEPDPTQTPSPSPTETPSEHPSTNISGSINGNTVSLSWGKIEDPALEGYKVMYSFYDTTPVYGESKCYYKYWITNASTTSCSLDITSLNDYSEGAVCYFSITALYEDHSVKKPGSVISFTAPAAEPYAATNISVSLSGNNVYTSWAAIDDERLEGYKVVASFTDTSPSYPDNGYAAWITNGSTSYTISESYIKGLDGYEPGKTCYFAITAVYSGSKKTGSVASLEYPY